MDLTHKLSDTTDPVIIADLYGKVSWSNPAALLLKEKIGNILDIFNEDDATSILNNQSVLCAHADLSHLYDFNLQYALTSCLLGGATPDTQFHLIVLKAAESKISDANLKSENDLSSVAHDLKNPLGAIFGYADALVDTGLGADLSPRHREVLTRIRSTAVRSIELVRNLQQLSNLQSGLIPLSSKTLDMNQIVEMVHKGTWRENSSQPKVEIELSKEPLYTNIERILIDRVITNLYSNALKFTPKDGVISIKTSVSAEHNIFEINNNKPHIEDSEINKIFDNRYRAKTSQGTSGTGLGLFIVKEIMKKVAGSVAVESNHDKGTTFTAYFPL